MTRTIRDRGPRISNEHVKLRVLLKNKRMCCVCHVPERPVQLHHIDGDHSHTVEANLAVLCLTHHDQATAGIKSGQVGLGVKLTPDEVRAHKAAWERTVASEHRVQQRAVPQQKRKQIELFFEFELIKAKNEMFASPRAAEIRSRLKYLTEYLIEEFVTGVPFRRLLLDAFSDIAIRAAGDDRLAVPLIRALPNLHLHLIGPHEVSLAKADKTALRKTMDILETLGTFAISLSESSMGVREACRVIGEFAEIAVWYNQKDIVRAANTVLRKMLKEFRELSVREQRSKEGRAKMRFVQGALKSLSSKRPRRD